MGDNFSRCVIFGADDCLFLRLVHFAPWAPSGRDDLITKWDKRSHNSQKYCLVFSKYVALSLLKHPRYLWSVFLQNFYYQAWQLITTQCVWILLAML